VLYDFGGHRVRVASLLDVVRSKQVVNRDKDRLVLPTLRGLLERSAGPDGRDDAPENQPPSLDGDHRAE
jgi:hypothetical protein